MTADRGMEPTPSRVRLLQVGALLALFCAMFFAADQAYYRFLVERFPPVGDSATLATVWGLLSRAHVALPVLAVSLWKPRAVGLRRGAFFSHWKMLVLMLAVNCGVIAGYLWLTGTGTPYSGNQWLVTEVVTVPIIEELLWRGVIFALVATALGGAYGEATAATIAAWMTGIAFGVLHLGNAFAGVPLGFAAVQALSAAIWGVMYGYARARTQSVYPAIVLHSGMNLVVVLF